jgi:cell division FtsZ-interacting protein ZapD
VTVRLNFTSGFDAIIRKKRLAGLLEIKSFIENLNTESLATSDLDSLESIGHELQSFYASTAAADQAAIETLLKQLNSSVSVLRVKDRKGSLNSLQKVLTKLQFHMSRIITSELTKMNNGVSVMVEQR